MMWRWLFVEMLIVVLLAPACAKTPGLSVASAPAPGGAASRDSASGPGGAVAPASGARPVEASAPGQGPGQGQGQGRQETSAPGPGQAGGPPPATVAPRPKLAEFATAADLHDVYFDFDKYDVRPGDAKILEANAKWLNANAGYLFLVEGHCDERGTDAYNLALGEKRAKATLNYLVAQGVAANRATIISYGKERPACTERSEDCWAKNRRAHFTAKR